MNSNENRKGKGIRSRTHGFAAAGDGDARMKRKSREIYMRFLLSALPVLLIPVLLMTAAYWRNLNVFKQEVYDKNLSLLQNNARIVENMVASVENILNYLNKSVAVNNFLAFQSLNDDGTNTEAVTVLQKDIKSLVAANDIIDNIQIYSFENQMLLDNISVVVNLDRYYNHSFSIQNMDMEEWKSSFLTRKNETKSNFISLKSGSDGKDLLFYTSNLPIESGRYNKGTVFIIMDQTKLIQNFSNIDYEENGFIYIQDKDGNLLYEDNRTGVPEIKLSQEQMAGEKGFFLGKAGEKKLFITYYIDRNGWVYASAIPRELAEGPVKDNLIYLWVMSGFALLIGIVLIHFVTNRLSKPITRIYDLVGKKGQVISYNEFDEAIEKLMKENEQMQDELEKQIPAMKISIFHTLVSGGFQTVEEIKDKLEKMRVHTGASQYIILIASLNDLNMAEDLEKIAAQKVYIKNMLCEILETEQVYDLELDRIGILLEYDCSDIQEARRDCEKKLSVLITRLENNIAVSLTLHGDALKGIAEIPSGFKRVSMAMSKDQEPLKGPVRWYDKSRQEKQEGCYYPIEIEEKLLDSVLGGQRTETELVLEQIKRHNQRTLESGTETELVKLLKAMNLTLKRVYTEEREITPEEGTEAERRIDGGITENERHRETFDFIGEELLRLAELRKERRLKENSPIKQRLKKYIGANYTNPQISLTLVADEFGISEVYLSRMFKQSFEQNFSKYIEELRIEKAKSLIEEGKYKVAEIAEQVGYNSPQSFRRAYKRVCGCTPKE